MNSIRVDDVLEVFRDRLGDELDGTKDSQCMADGRPEVAQETDGRMTLIWFNVGRHSLNEDR
jgi:hypothetical protein